MGRGLPAQPRRLGWLGAIVAGAALLIGSGALAQEPAPGVSRATTETTLAAATQANGHSAVRVQVVPPGRGTFTVMERLPEGGAKAIGAAAVDKSGAAKVSTDGLPAGDHTLYAEYSGDKGHIASTSQVTGVHAEQSTTASDFSLGIAPASLNLTAGQFGTITVAVSPLDGFSGYVTLACSGLPLSTTCTFTPESVFLGSGTKSATSDMVLATSGPAGPAKAETASGGRVYAFLLPGFLGLIGLGATRKRAWRALSLMGVMVMAAGGLSSCSQRWAYLYYPPQADIGTPPGTSTISIQATAINGSNVIVHSANIALTVTAAPGQ
jgi:hypothetical protein